MANAVKNVIFNSESASVEMKSFDFDDVQRLQQEDECFLLTEDGGFLLKENP